MARYRKEGDKPRSAYPRGAYFCLLNEFAERYASLGIQAVLTFYLLGRFGLSKSDATVAFHAYVCLSYFTTILGSIWADGFSGPYKVMLYTSSAYCFGPLLLALSGVSNSIVDDRIMKSVGIVGLFVTAFCSGGRRPCAVAFSADQFPDSMVEERKRFFSTAYLLAYLSGIVTQTATPYFRASVSCFGQNTCYPMAFGAGFISVTLALIIFLLGRNTYINTSNKRKGAKRENVVAKTFKCLMLSIGKNFGKKAQQKSDKQLSLNAQNIRNGMAMRGSRYTSEEPHWLDSAKYKYGSQFVADVKRALQICSMLTPTIVFWALYFQIGSTFVIQGSAMNTRIGQLTILPDQLIMSSSVFVVFLIIALDYGVYPALKKAGRPCTPLKRLGIGFFLGVISFGTAGVIQLKLNSAADPKPPVGYSKYSFLNLATNKIEVELNDEFIELSRGAGAFGKLIVPENANGSHYKYNNATFSIESFNDASLHDQASEPSLVRRENFGKLIIFWDYEADVNESTLEYKLHTTEHGGSRWYVRFHDKLTNFYDMTVTFRSEHDESRQFVSDGISPDVNLFPPKFGSNVFDILLESCQKFDRSNNDPAPAYNSTACNTTLIGRYAALSGAAHALLINHDWTVYNITLISANQMSLVWQLPQYCLLSAGDMLVSVAGVEFAYTEAAPTMKSILQAFRLITCTLGNIVDMTVSSSGLITNSAMEFFFWAIVMMIVLLMHVIMSVRYRYASNDEEKQIMTNDPTSKTGCSDDNGITCTRL